MAEPLALRLAAELGALWGVEPETRRHPESLARLTEELRTFSMFAPGRIVVAVESGALADREAAEALLAEVRDALPWSGSGEELSGRPRQAALRLLQVLRLHDLDPGSDPPERLLGGLPDELLVGRRGRGAKAAARAEELRGELAPLLTAAIAAGLRGIGESEATLLADLLRDGLPERHVLILVESSVSDRHPVVEALRRRDAVLEAGRLEAGKRGVIEGLDRLLEELANETGVAIDRPAGAELARRTLRGVARRGAPSGAIDADSSERFAAEYRKLAGLARGSTIDLDLVRAQTEDRGEQDVWEILDAIGSGRGGDALARLERRLAGAEDAAADRLAFFALLAGFARHLSAVSALVRELGLPPAEGHYGRFKERVAPRLQGRVEGLERNPLEKLHPFRLHRAYLAAARFDPGELASLPALLLDTELRLKGESGEADAALAELVLRLARPGLSPAPGPSAGSRRRAGGGGRS